MGPACHCFHLVWEGDNNCFTFPWFLFFVVYFTRRFVLYFTLLFCSCVFFFVFFFLFFLFFFFFSPFSIAITSLGEERANLSAFRTFVRFVLVWFCCFPFPLGFWEGLRFVIVALLGLFFYLFCGMYTARHSFFFFLFFFTYPLDNKEK